MIVLYNHFLCDLTVLLEINNNLYKFTTYK